MNLKVKENSVSMSQTKYYEKSLQQFGVQDSKPRKASSDMKTMTLTTYHLMNIISNRKEPLLAAAIYIMTSTKNHC